MPIRLTLTGMAHGGEAVGRYQGKVIFLPYVSGPKLHCQKNRLRLYFASDKFPPKSIQV